jgi:hypothetical protein
VPMIFDLIGVDGPSGVCKEVYLCLGHAVPISLGKDAPLDLKKGQTLGVRLQARRQGQWGNAYVDIVAGNSGLGIGWKASCLDLPVRIFTSVEVLRLRRIQTLEELESVVGAGVLAILVTGLKHWRPLASLVEAAPWKTDDKMLAYLFGLRTTLFVGRVADTLSAALFKHAIESLVLSSTTTPNLERKKVTTEMAAKEVASYADAANKLIMLAQQHPYLFHYDPSRSLPDGKLKWMQAHATEQTPSFEVGLRLQQEMRGGGGAIDPRHAKDSTKPKAAKRATRAPTGNTPNGKREKKSDRDGGENDDDKAMEDEEKGGPHADGGPRTKGPDAKAPEAKRGLLDSLAAERTDSVSGFSTGSSNDPGMMTALGQFQQATSDLAIARKEIEKLNARVHTLQEEAVQRDADLAAEKATVARLLPYAEQYTEQATSAASWHARALALEEQLTQAKNQTQVFQSIFMTQANIDSTRFDLFMNATRQQDSVAATTPTPPPPLVGAAGAGFATVSGRAGAGGAGAMAGGAGAMARGAGAMAGGAGAMAGGAMAGGAGAVACGAGAMAGGAMAGGAMAGGAGAMAGGAGAMAGGGAGAMAGGAMAGGAGAMDAGAMGRTATPQHLVQRLPLSASSPVPVAFDGTPLPPPPPPALPPPPPSTVKERAPSATHNQLPSA